MVEADAKRDGDGNVEALDRFFGVAREQGIEQALPAQDAERDFCGERGVFGFYGGVETGVKKFGGVGVFGCDARENFERDFAGCANRQRIHPW